MRVVGDSDMGEVERDLTRISGELDAFGAQDVQAEIDLETRRFKDELAVAKAELKSLATEKASPEVDLQTAGLRAHIAQVEAQLAILGARSVEVDVDVDRDGTARSGLRGIIDLGRQAWDALGNLLSDGAKSASSSMVGLGGSAGSSGANVSTLATFAGEAAAVIGVALVAAIAAAIIAVVALASSAIAAAGALGALATAALALIGPFAALAVGAIARFKEEADKAGTAAHALKSIATDLANVFKSTLGPAADAVFRGLAIGIKALIPTIRSLRPEFSAFGQVAGNSLRNLLLLFASPAWRAFFSLLVRSASQALPALTSSFAFLASIFRNIATASMPFLIAGFRSVARSLGGIASGTSNVSALRGQIAGLVVHLRAWIALAGQLGRVFFGVIRAAAPTGLELVGWLTQGAQAIADWINSAEGQERIKQFFSDTLPLVKQLVTLFGQLAIAAAEIFQFLAPAMTTLISGVNLLLRPVLILLDLLNQIPASVRSWLVPFGVVIATVTNLISAAQALGGVWAGIRSAAVAAFNGVKNAASSAWGAVRGIFSRGISFVINLPKNAIGLASNLWSTVSGIIKKGISFALSLPRTAIGLASSLWSTVRGIIVRGIAFAINLPSIGSLTSAASRIWEAVKAALPDITINIHIPTPHIPHIDVPGLSLHPIGEVGEALAAKWNKHLGEGLQEMMGTLDVSLAVRAAALTPAAALTGAGATTINNQINAPAGQLPDPEATLALIDMKQRSRGKR